MRASLIPALHADAPPPREVLILEPDAEGHSQEWLQHLAEFVAADETAAAISVVAPATLVRRTVAIDARRRRGPHPLHRVEAARTQAVHPSVRCRSRRSPAGGRCAAISSQRRRHRILSLPRSSLPALRAGTARSRESRSVAYCSGLRCTTVPSAATGRVPARDCGICARISSTG